MFDSDTQQQREKKKSKHTFFCELQNTANLFIHMRVKTKEGDERRKKKKIAKYMLQI